MRVHKGFTLIELLVVIAIIAILAAILFPVFAQAREKARQSTCTSNQKQIGIALLEYVQDSDEQFPAWAQYYQPLGINYWWPAAVAPYLKSTAVFACPDDTGVNNIQLSQANAFKTAVNNSAMNNGDFSLQSYGINFDIIMGASNNTAIKTSQINQPSALLLMTETWDEAVPGEGFGAPNWGQGAAGGGIAWYSTCTGTPVLNDLPANSGCGNGFATPIARHTGMANVLYADGHAKALAYGNIYNPPAGVTPANYELWHPNAP